MKTQEEKPKGKKAQEQERLMKLGKLVLDEKKYYEQATQKLRLEWDELYDLYIGKLPPSKHKSLSRNFVPKVHQAVETMASFLAGNNPSLFVTPVGMDDDDKARFMAKLLEFQWQKIHMKPKVLTWAKSGILFGVGIMKTGWDSEEDDLFCYPVNIADFYTSPFERDLQKSPSTIERLVLPIEYVEKKYKVSNLQPIGSTATNLNDSTMFDVKDIDPVSRSLEKRVEVLERHTLDTVVTVIVQPEKDEDGKVKEKGLVVRETKKKKPRIPYVSFHAKDSPLPNRFYTTGFISPVARTQKRMNQVLNQMTDNINLMMQPSAKVRRGSAIDPKELIRYSGRAIYMNDVNRDMEWDVIPDTTASGRWLMNYLDTEFQRGTTVTSLRQGEGGSGTAAEARLQQSNLDTTTNLVKENLEDAVAQLGTMMSKINIENITKIKSIRIFDPHDVFNFEVQNNLRPQDPMNPGMPLPMGQAEIQDIKNVGRGFKINPGDLDGDYDIRVQADSTLMQNKDVLRKQTQDWLSFLSGMGTKINVDEATRDWGMLSGLPNAMKYIDKTPTPPAPAKPADQAKILEALASLVKDGAEVYPNQVQAALMGQWPLPQGQGQPVVSPKIANDFNQQMAAQGGPGGGQGTGLPSPTDTGSTMTQQGQEMSTQIPTQPM